MAERKWEDLNRTEKLANIMFPHLAPKEIQEEMKQLAANEGKQHRLSPFQQDFTSSIQQMLLDLSWRSLTESNPSDGEFVELAKGRLQLALLRCALLETVGRRLRLSAAERPTVWYGAVSPEDARGRRQ